MNHFKSSMTVCSNETMVLQAFNNMGNTQEECRIKIKSESHKSMNQLTMMD